MCSRFERQNFFHKFGDVCVLMCVLDDEIVGKKLFVIRATVDVLLETNWNKLLERLRKFSGWKRWWIFCHHLLQLLERRSKKYLGKCLQREICLRVEALPPCSIREPASCHLDHADTQRPYITSDIIIGHTGALRIDSFRCHVRFTSWNQNFRISVVPVWLSLSFKLPASMVFATESTK